MLKIILKRLWKQRWQNQWLFAELFLVFILLAALADLMYVVIKPSSLPLGYNLERVYYLKIGYNFDYFQEDISDEEYARVRRESMKEMFRRVERLPEVASASLFMGTHPYQVLNSLIFQEDSLKKTNCYVTHADKNFFKVFNLFPQAGDMGDWDSFSSPIPLLVSRCFADTLSDRMTGKSKVLGVMLYEQEREAIKYRVTGITADVKITPNMKYAPNVFLPLKEEMLERSTPYVAIRIQPEQESYFEGRVMEQFKKELNVGPYYLDELKSYTDIKESAYITNTMNRIIRLGGFFAFFLILNVFLGVIGSFRFRTLSRMEEIGVRKALGACSGTILKELLSEGGVLLLCASLPALVICLNLIWFELPITDLVPVTAERVMLDVLLPYVMIGSMVFAGIWFPAHKIMKVVPAEAIRNE